MKTSVEVKASTRALLKLKKEELGLKSADEVIAHLLGQPDRVVDADDVVLARRKRSRVADEEEEDKRVPQLLSYEVLAREPAALKWFTGMKEQALNWTMGALRDAVIILSCFHDFASCGHSKVTWAMMWALIVVPFNLALSAEEEYPDA
jgi:hypothetical protein